MSGSNDFMKLTLPTLVQMPSPMTNSDCTSFRNQTMLGIFITRYLIYIVTINIYFLLKIHQYKFQKISNKLPNRTWQLTKYNQEIS